MDDGSSPTLEVGFAIETGESFADLIRLQAVMDSTEGKIVADAARIERATGGMVNLTGATASISSFGNAATRDLQAAARDLGRVEKSGEALVRQLDRQNAAFGKTREELRGVKAETAALAAEQKGLTELAGRIRAAEGALFDQELAAARAARFEAEAATQAKEQAANEAVAAAAREAQAIREASFAYNMFEARVRQGAAALRELEAAEKAASRDNAAAQLRAEAGAASQLAAEHARLAAVVRGSHDAQLADAAAAERLRETTDPLYAATKRLNAEIAESTRLYHAGATAPAEYARQQQVLTQRLTSAAQQHDVLAASSRRSGFAMKQFAIQLPDIAQGLLTGQKPMTVFIQQGGQLAQIGMMAEGGLKGFVKQIGALALVAAPALVAVGAVAGVAYGALKLFQSQVKDSGDLTRFRDNLGLTHKEMLKLSDGVESAGGKIKKLGEVTVTTSDILAGLWKAIKDNAQAPVGDWSGFTGAAVDAFKKVLDAWGVVSAGITAGIYGTANAAKIIWQNFATSVGDAFYQSVNFAIAAMNKLVESGTYLLNGFIHGANKIPGLNIGDVAATKIAPVTNPYEGASSQKAADAALKAIGDGYTKAYADAKKADADFWKQVGSNAKQNAKDRLTEEAAAIKANRTPPKPKVDHNALNAEATEAQIRNLYKLADAYGVSGAAALIAEARVKAESAAIKHGADVEAAVAQQVRLAVAERVKTAAQGTAAMVSQIAIQKQVNAEIAAGNIPAALAGEMIRDRLADLPFLDAAEAARMAGDAKGAKAALAQLDDLRGATIKLNDAQKETAVKVALAGGDDQLAQLREELRLVGAIDAERVKSLAILKATQDANRLNWTGPEVAKWITQQGEIAETTKNVADAQSQLNEQLRLTSDLADGVGDSLSKAFGSVGDSIGSAIRILGRYGEERQKIADAVRTGQLSESAGAKRSAELQITSLIGITDAAKNLFAEHSAGYEAMAAAEKILAVLQLVRLAQTIKADAAEAVSTAKSIANSVAKTAVKATEAVVNALASLPFPANLLAGAATIAALAAIGVSIAGSFGGGSKNTLPKANDGSGSVLGDATAKSDSIANAISALKEVDLLTNSYSREMAASLKSIDSQIGNVAALVVRGGDINASAGVTEGFKSNLIGSVLGKIPVIGGLLSSLFGSKTSVTASGLFGGPQSLGSVLGGGFNAQTYSDVEKTKKFLGITTGHSYSTQYGSADPQLASQFTLILKSFNDAIAAAAGPLGESTDTIQARLNSFVINLGKIDLQGLTGAQIQEKLSAIFGAAADGMANAAFPGIAQFQKVGEGAFETLVRVSSTIEAVGTSLDLLGQSARGMGIAAKLGLADQFDSLSDLTSAADAYFQAFYSQEEQAAAKTAQLGNVFTSLGLSMPATLAAFRQLVEAQDLTTAAGQSTYATLLKLAPAFADLQSSLEGAKSAADIASERLDLQRQLLELRGDTAAIRALDLAKVDPSNRALQQQIYDLQDAQAAAKAAQDLADAWKSAGDSITDEVKRIRGLSETAGGGGFASLQGQFNAANAAARGGDIDAAKSLPGLSQALLTAASLVATSKQELDRVQAQTAAMLEATNATIAGLAGSGASAGSSSADILAAGATSQAASPPPAANDDLIAEVQALRGELVQMRADNNAGHAATAGNTGSIKKTLDNVTQQSGGDAISTVAA